MDEDELADRQKTAVKTTANYDTFGDTATEMAKKAAAADAQARPSAIPGAIFNDLITLVPDSIGRQHTLDARVYCLTFAQTVVAKHFPELQQALQTIAASSFEQNCGTTCC